MRHSKRCKGVAESHLKLIAAVDLHIKLANLMPDDNPAAQEKCLQIYELTGRVDVHLDVSRSQRKERSSGGPSLYSHFDSLPLQSTRKATCAGSSN